jgi:acyl-CoA hydrolase
VQACVDAIVERVGRRLVVATPLGIGKPNHILNEIYRRAEADPTITLRILTALSLQRPKPRSELERRLVEPLMERLLGQDYPDLAYLEPRRSGRMPSNIEVIEFYFPPGAELNSPRAQQSYVSTNYTDVQRDMERIGPNVLAQLVAGPRDVNGVASLSLASNTDLSLDLIERHADNPEHAIVGQTNAEMPFLGGDAAVPVDRFAYLLDHPSYEFRLFGPPNEPISAADHWIGLHASVLVRDGGTLQLGIGALSDAVAYHLIARHQRPSEYASVLEAGGILTRHQDLVRDWGGTEPFAIGLYANTEMLVSGFLHLLEADVLKRRVYEDLETQRRADRGEVIADCDGANTGKLAHAGFFLGPRSFYRALRELDEAQRASIAMTRISYINRLYGEHEDLKRLQRRHARFFNSALMMTLLGAAVSDGLEDGRVLSGVGGQYNFVAMANELDDGRSILMLRATHRKGSKVSSNLRWSYGHTTIPRYLRDIVITEYGIADLRGKTDREIILELLAICDARFQEPLLAEAKRHGKLRASDRIQDRWRENRPERLESFVAERRPLGLFPALPFGTDLTPEELVLGRALRQLKDDVAKRRFWPTARALRATLVPPRETLPYLERMRLDRPSSLRERLLRTVVLYALARTTAP